MSYRQLLRTTIKKTDEKIVKVPKRYYWIFGGIILPVIITLCSFGFSPYLPTFTFIQLVASMLFFGVALSPVLVMTSFVSILGILFISTLREERRKEEEEQAKIGLREIKNTVKETLPEILDKNDIATNTATKRSLDLANRSYQKHDELIIKLQEEIEKLKSKDAQTEERFNAIESELQRQLEKNNEKDRIIRIKEKALVKKRSLLRQAEWERDQFKSRLNVEKPKNVDKLKRKTAIRQWWKKITEKSKDHE
jgi:hypothetical protein